MPATRLRARDGSVLDFIVGRRSDLDGKEEGNGSDSILTSIPTLDRAPDSSAHRRQLDPSTFEINIGLDRDELRPQPTGTAIASTDPSGTDMRQFPSPPPSTGRTGGISQTTEHLLIAAGSIGATIIVVMIILGIYTMRKRGLSFSAAARQAKNNAMGRRPDPPPKQTSSWIDNKQPYRETFDSMRKDPIAPPPQAASIGRSESTSSQRPLVALQRSDSFNDRKIPDHSALGQPSTFLIESPPPSRSNSHRREVSNTPSSPVLPLQTNRQSESTHNTRSMSEVSELRYPDPVPERDVSPLPPPPTFKQFLSNRPSASQKNSGFANMASRFSWTNSNAPQTPHEPSRDTSMPMYGRDSFMTQRSSVPRFRTISSWVDQQANRLEAQKLKEQFRLTQTSTVYSGDDDRDSTPSVPEIPAHVSRQQGYVPSHVRTSSNGTPLTPPPQPSGGLPGRNIKHERSDTKGTVDTIFRQHPGTEVRFSTRSMVPSEIFEQGARPNVLS